MNSLILYWSVDTTCFFELIELLFLFFSWCVRGEYLYLQCYPMSVLRFCITIKW